jgi:type I restriction enzyme S subunit
MTPMRTFRLGDLGSIVTGRTPPAANPEYFGSEMPFLTPTDIDGVSRHVTTGRFLSSVGASAFLRILLPPQSVCCVCIGATIGKVCLTQSVSASNQQINSIIVDRDQHDPRFVYYKVVTLGQVLKARAGGAATPIARVCP